MPKLKAKNVSTMVLDHPTVQAIAAFVGPIEGILGFTFYARYKTSIDYEKKLITFEPSTYEPGDVMKAMSLTHDDVHYLACNCYGDDVTGAMLARRFRNLSEGT